MVIKEIENINDVIKIIGENSKSDYNLGKAFNEEYINHCNCNGSDCVFTFIWEEEEYEILNNSIILENEEIEEKFNIRFKNNKFINEDVKQYLDCWCKKNNDQFNKYWWEIKKNNYIYIYKYNSSSDIKEKVINIFYTNEELLKFVKENKEYIQSNIDFEKKIKKELEDDGIFI